MTKLFLLFVAGGLGSLSRYGLNAWIASLTSHDSPLRTVTVNLLGCLLIGMAHGVSSHRGWLDPQQTLILTVGFLGAFTTFSTFAFEAEALFREGRWLHLSAYILVQNVLGVAMVFLGDRLVR